MVTEFLKVIDQSLDTRFDLDLRFPEVPEIEEIPSTPQFRVPTIRKKRNESESSVDSSGTNVSSISTRRTRFLLDSDTSLDSPSSTRRDRHRPTVQRRKKTHIGSNGFFTDLGVEHERLNLPAYYPPPFVAVTFFKHVCRDDISQKLVKKPEIPLCKTNTNLATYVHRLYVYQLYINREHSRPYQSVYDGSYVSSLDLISFRLSQANRSRTSINGNSANMNDFVSLQIEDA